MRGGMRIRSDRGGTTFWVVLGAVLVAGVLLAIPIVMMTRQESGVALQANASNPSSAVGQAEDVQAQVLLQTAIGGAKVYFAENGTFQGYAEAAGQLEPSISYTTGPAAQGLVSIRGVTATTVVLVTETQAGFLCAAANQDIVTFGRADASSPSGCQGGW